MSGTTPCNCPEPQGLAAYLPATHEVRGALEMALGGFGVTVPPGTPNDPIPDPSTIVVAPIVAAEPAGDLAALVALVRNHPGLKITLSYERGSS